MAFRTWLKLLLATLGVGALAGASQLGLGYGLGIVRLTRVLDATTRDQWTAQLAWVAWFAMVAAVIGALAGSGLLLRWSPTPRTPPAPGATTPAPPPEDPADSSEGRTRPAAADTPRPPDPPTPSAGTAMALAVAAAIGAGVVVPLTMQPARTAQIAGVNAVVVIAICAGLGAIVGIFAAYAALAQAVARWSLATVAIAVWIVALISVSPSLGLSDPLPTIRLGVFDAGFLSPAITQRTALFTMPAIALLAGAALGWRARRQERPTLTIALAGLPGPALLTLAYLIAGPGSGDDRYQVVPYWAAMTAAGAGVLGSVLAAVLRRGSGPDDDDSDGPTAGRPTLPRRPDQPESTIAQAATGPAASFVPAASAPPSREDTQAGTLRPSDTGVFDAPTGQVRPAPSGRNPLAAPWSPAASGASAPWASSPGRRPSAADAFGARGGEPLTRRPDPATQNQASGIALGEYAVQEPAAFGGLTRGVPKQPLTGPGRAQHAAPEQAAIQDRSTTPAVAGAASGPAHTDQAGYVPEPATRPLPPEVLGTPARGGALSRGLRSLGRGRPPGSAHVDLPFASAQAHPDAGAHAAEPEPKSRRRSRREPQAGSAPLAQPTPITPPPWQPEPTAPASWSGPTAPAEQPDDLRAKGGSFGFGRTAPAARAAGDTAPGLRATSDETAIRGAGARGGRPGETAVPGAEARGARPDETAPGSGRHGDAPADQNADRTSGRRFGMKKRKENNEYVDWVSGLGND